MKSSASNRNGFTIIELVLVVAIMGTLAAIAIPHFVKARDPAQANACINNLRELDTALQTYAVEHKLPSNASYVLDDLKPYVHLNGEGEMPKCPAGGSYIEGLSLTNSPTCSLSNDTPPHVR